MRRRDYYDINFILCFPLQVQRRGIIRNNGSLLPRLVFCRNNPPLLDDCNKRNRRPENNVSTKYQVVLSPLIVFADSTPIFWRSFSKRVFVPCHFHGERENFSRNSIFLFSVIVPLYLARSMLVFRIDSGCRIWRVSRDWERERAEIGLSRLRETTYPSSTRVQTASSKLFVWFLLSW